MVELNAWIDEIPPLVQRSRFGNKAFRIWFDRLCEVCLLIFWMIVVAFDWICWANCGTREHREMQRGQRLLGRFFWQFPTSWLRNRAWNHFFRIFVYVSILEFERKYCDWLKGNNLGCLYKTLVLKREELAATILLVFPAYLKVCRHLQTVYWLEPAGSHGVWCLDDYQLLPFLFGSSQLIGRLWVVVIPCPCSIYLLFGYYSSVLLPYRKRGVTTNLRNRYNGGEWQFFRVYVFRSDQIY